MNDLEHAGELLVQAKADFDAMRGMIANANDEHGISYFTDNIFGFMRSKLQKKFLRPGSLLWAKAITKSMI